MKTACVFVDVHLISIFKWQTQNSGLVGDLTSDQRLSCGRGLFWVSYHGFIGLEMDISICRQRQLCYGFFVAFYISKVWTYVYVCRGEWEERGEGRDMQLNSIYDVLLVLPSVLIVFRVDTVNLKYCIHSVLPSPLCVCTKNDLYNIDV